MKSYDRCQCYQCRRHAVRSCTQKDSVICPDVGKTCQETDEVEKLRLLGEQLRSSVRELQELGCRIVVGSVEDFGVGYVEIIKERRL